MSVCVLLSLLAALANLPAVEVDTIKGARHAGQLVELTSAAVRLRTTETAVDVPLSEAIEVRFVPAPAGEPSVGPRIVLTDGTRLTLKEIRVAGDRATLETGPLGSLAVPVNRLAQVRFGASNTKLDQAWNALLERDSKNDMLVTRKEDVLDFLPGVVGDVGEKVGFLLDKEEIPVPREKVYGLIYRRRSPTQPKAVCKVNLVGGDSIEAAQVRFEGERLQLKTASGIDITVPVRALKSLDFGAGKIQYLSQLEPREVKYVPFFDVVWEYRRDRSIDGSPITLAGKAYPRGLAIHSKTQLRYRIAGDYSRFQAMMGIDDSVERQGEVFVRIAGDGRVLHESVVKGTDPPRPLDLDVSGVRDLDILVDFGDPQAGDRAEETADHLDLADARLIK